MSTEFTFAFDRTAVENVPQLFSIVLAWRLITALFIWASNRSDAPTAVAVSATSPIATSTSTICMLFKSSSLKLTPFQEPPPFKCASLFCFSFLLSFSTKQTGLHQAISPLLWLYQIPSHTSSTCCHLHSSNITKLPTAAIIKFLINLSRFLV